MMKVHAIVSTAGAERIREALAAMAALLPPPAPPPPPVPPGGTRCVHAEDSGEPAFPNRPCRGHRIECRKAGLTTCAASCRPDKCNFYQEEQGS